MRHLARASRLIMVIGLAGGIAALVWQARTIRELRAEVASMRTDLRTFVESALQKPLDPSAESDQERRDKLELIKLRHQVRELNEKMVESHARERAANVRTVIRSVLPTPTTSGPWNIRPEWKVMEAQATNQYLQAIKALDGATNEYVRFLCLDRAAKMSLAVGRTENARQFATDMLLLNDKYSRGEPENANGDVVYNGHVVLGRIALDEGEMEEAKRHLLAAGKSKGSPV